MVTWQYYHLTTVPSRPIWPFLPDRLGLWCLTKDLLIPFWWLWQKTRSYRFLQSILRLWNYFFLSKKQLVHTSDLTFSPGPLARRWQVFHSRAVFCICKRKEMYFYEFTDGDLHCLWGQGVMKATLFSRGNGRCLTSCKILKSCSLSQRLLNSFHNNKNRRKKLNHFVKERVQDAEVMLQLCSYVLDNGFGRKGWHCDYNLPR